MTIRDHLIEQHFIEHEARLKHIDEMIKSAHDKISVLNVSDEAKNELQDIAAARDELKSNYFQMRLKLDENWEHNLIQSAGPMGVLDTVAQRIEKLIEYLEKRKH